MPKKPKTVSQLKKTADTVFSQYIRQFYADSHTGYVACVTCGQQKPWKQMQNGHYEKRSSQYLRYDERNCFVQCASCNVFKNGNYPRYAQFMLKNFGQERLDELEKDAQKIKQWTSQELEDIISHYKAKLEGLKT